MPNRLLRIIVILSFFSILSYAQQGQGDKKGASITGIVFDSSSKIPVEYANIVLLSSKDSTQVTGTVTGKNGRFLLTSIRPGNYYLSAQFIGFSKHIIKNLVIGQNSKTLDVGNIYLKSTSINLENVVIEGARLPVSYQIDKKVIDVDQMQTVVSGNAADVLENIPSVTVDIDGNVSLRGSTSFTVLVDGRPSVMDAQDILQQIPASSIKTIEVITNPSAKYDPEGNAGIINIKLKKEENYGLSGVVNANTGVNNRYGGDFLFEYKTPSVGYNASVDYNRRFHPGSSLENKTFDLSNGTSFLNSNGSSERGRISFGLRGGLDFYFDGGDVLSFGGRYGYRDGQNNEVQNYSKWTSLDPAKDFYLSTTNRKRSGNFYAFNSNLMHKFNRDGHQLTAEFFLSHRESDEHTLSSEVQNGAQFGGRNTTENGPSTHLRGKIEYVLPFSENSKFEAGSQGEIEKSTDGTNLFEYNPQTGNYDFQLNYSNTIDYDNRELAIYTIYQGELNNFQFQGGIRTEYTYQDTKLATNNQTFNINRWDFFPTFHTSYKFSGGTQLMASYTRRIDRPHGWELEPFYTWMDANNVRIGNPSLLPEFIDSYELSAQTYFGKFALSNDFYYKVSHNKIEHIQSAYSENVTLTSFDNIGQDYSLGTEFMVTVDPLSIWNLSVMGNVYDYRIEGMLYGEPFTRTSFNWTTRISNSLKFSETFQIQVNTRYNSPSVSTQGKREGYFRTDVAVKKQFLDKKLSLTLQVRDLFQTAKWEYTSQGADFYSYIHHTRQAPMVT